MVIGGDYMFKKRLTNKQMDVMNILWENDKPMAASEILKANEKLNINTIHACIRKLLEEERRIKGVARYVIVIGTFYHMLLVYKYSLHNITLSDI